MAAALGEETSDEVIQRVKAAVLGRPHDTLKRVVEVKGIEPLAPCMQSRCSPAELHPHGIYA